jgi:hypothetical protein
LTWSISSQNITNVEHPKLTAAVDISSRSSPSSLDAIDAEKHVPETVSTACTSS